MSDLFLTSRLLPVRHGFSLRTGGVSEGPWASLNLGRSVGDDPARVEENLARLARAAGVEGGFAAVSQVHGDAVLKATGPSLPGAPVLGEADALWTDRPGVALGIRTADCVPILLVDPEGGRIAAVHSGWKGTDLKIARKAVEVLRSAGSAPERILAAVGPAIRACCDEVSEDLAERFGRASGEGAVSREAGRPHLDLPFAVRQTLLESGLSGQNIGVLPLCTACEEKRFFSHRRDRGLSGRHLSFISL